MKTLSLILASLALLTSPAFAQKKKSVAPERSYMVSTYFWAPALSFGKYLNSDGILQIEAGGGRYVSANMNSRYHANINYKHYFPGFWFGSDFFLKGGLDYSQLSYSFDDQSSNSRSGFSFKGNNLSALAAMGHEWRKNSWVFGVDWINIRAPLTWQITEERTINGSTYEKQNMDDEERIYLKSVQFEYLYLYLGYNF